MKVKSPRVEPLNSVLLGLIVFPAEENVLSSEVDEAGIARIWRATLRRRGKLSDVFQKCRMSNSSDATVVPEMYDQT